MGIAKSQECSMFIKRVDNLTFCIFNASFSCNNIMLKEFSCLFSFNFLKIYIFEKDTAILVLQKRSTEGCSKLEITILEK